jgi:hypothetical protein
MWNEKRKSAHAAGLVGGRGFRRNRRGNPDKPLDPHLCPGDRAPATNLAGCSSGVFTNVLKLHIYIPYNIRYVRNEYEEANIMGAVGASGLFRSSTMKALVAPSATALGGRHMLISLQSSIPPLGSLYDESSITN